MSVLVGCGTSGSVLDKLVRELDRFPEYSIILEDMRRDDGFFPDYQHRYRLLWVKPGGTEKDGAALGERVTGWYTVDKKTYDKYRSCLGMTIVAKNKDGRVDRTPQPPGYQYVGDQRFGRWRTDQRGNRFWEWYGKYMFFRTIFGGLGGYGYGPIRYDDWTSYRTTVSRRVPYYGRRTSDGRPAFGTGGVVTRKTHRTFFERQQQRMAARKGSFAQKVKSRMGRSRASGFRSRSGFFGK
ncbi:hypothetical protein [Desulfacinum hydrothermale]|uniref:hypothetical protein n=1 Tax=Desulfacinum hydrothermale TaxID=109258 RepID=UPI00111C562A|nr:hypothetical protein [Desulfacinum hydrothermale]